MIPLKSISKKLYPEYLKKALELQAQRRRLPPPRPQTILANRTAPPKEFPRNSPRSNRKLRPWQTTGFKALAPSKLRILIAPTGSGKTTLAIALAAHDIQRGNKIIIAYPQHDIAPGYEPMQITLPNGKSTSWNPVKLEDDINVRGEGKTEHIINFLKKPQPPGSEALICTHAALVLAYKQLDLENLNDDLWDNTSLFLDESHHSSFGDSDDEGICDINGLGKLVAHYTSRASTPLTLITATWMRTENRIVPPEALKQFTRYEYPIEEYLKSLRYLREVRMRFTIGDQFDALKSIIEVEPERKTLLYLQTGQSVSSKFASLGECQKVIEQFVPTENTIDLVDPHHRHQRQRELFNTIRAQTAKKEHLENNGRKVTPDQLPNGTPTVIYNLYKFCEGTDWPEASRAILMAPRGSIRMTLQILGRLLRDWPGKDNVQLDIIIPLDPDAKRPDPQKIVDYLKVILACMIVDWQFHRQNLLSLVPKGKRRSHLRKLVGDPEMARIISGHIVDLAIDSEGRKISSNKMAKEVTNLLYERGVFDSKGSGGNHPPDPVVQNYIRKLTGDTMRRMGQCLHEAKEIPFNPEIKSSLVDPSNPFSLIQHLAKLYGYTLSEIRVALGRMPQWTMEKIKAHIIAFRRKNDGKWPNNRSGIIDNDDRLWSSADQYLRQHGQSSLRLFCKKMGMPVHDSWTLKSIKECIITFQRKNNGRWPNQRSGIIDDDDRLWSSTDQHLRQHGQSSLRLFCKKMGMPVHDSWTLKSIKECVVTFQVKNNGKWPNPESGIIDGYNRSWSSANSYLLQQQSSLRLFCKKMGMPVHSDWTARDIRKNIVAFRIENNGKWPNQESGVINGDGRNWGSINSHLRQHKQSSLRLFCKKMGMPIRDEWTFKSIREHVLTFRKINEGKWPNCKSGIINNDGRRWSSVDQHLRQHEQSSLWLFCEKMKIPVRKIKVQSFQ